LKRSRDWYDAIIGHVCTGHLDVQKFDACVKSGDRQKKTAIATSCSHMSLWELPLLSCCRRFCYLQAKTFQSKDLKPVRKNLDMGGQSPAEGLRMTRLPAQPRK
jgi:hypothetical protein